MKLTERFKHKTVFSFEVFPPKNATSTAKLTATLQELEGIHPDFISVTLGAGGTAHHAGTVALADAIQNQRHIPAVVHIPGLYQSRADVAALLDQLQAKGIDNVLALRGDQIAGQTPVGAFTHADQLTRFIKSQGDFAVIGACYPECHQESKNAVEDTLHLKEKVDAGAEHLISQVFFDNQCFYDFQERASLAGIHVPIEAGIMPCTNKRQIERITQMAGIPLPKKFVAMLSRYEGNPEAMRDAGIAYAVDQIVDLVAQGVDGIHLYTMNRSDTAQRIWAATQSLFKASTLPSTTAPMTTKQR